MTGHELDDRGWMAELAWPDARTGVVLAPRRADGTDDDPEAADRDRAFAAAGWRVRPARVPAVLAELVQERAPLAPRMPSSRNRPRRILPGANCSTFTSPLDAVMPPAHGCGQTSGGSF